MNGCRRRILDLVRGPVVVGGLRLAAMHEAGVGAKSYSAETRALTHGSPVGISLPA